MARDEGWYMYVVECCDRSLYTGITNNLERRLYHHNFTSSGAKYTRSRRPVRLVYWTEHADRSSALKAESKFKKKTRGQKMEVIFWGAPSSTVAQYDAITCRDHGVLDGEN